MAAMKFRKMPVVIEAIQWTGDNTAEVAAFTLGQSGHVVLPGRSVVIETLEGDMRADVGDWIIKGVKGEFYPIKDPIFRETYEAMESA